MATSTKEDEPCPLTVHQGVGSEVMRLQATGRTVQFPRHCWHGTAIHDMMCTFTKTHLISYGGCEGLMPLTTSAQFAGMVRPA